MISITATIIISVYNLWFIQEDSEEALCEQPTDRLITGHTLSHHWKAVLLRPVVLSDPGQQKEEARMLGACWETTFFTYNIWETWQVSPEFQAEIHKAHKCVVFHLWLMVHGEFWVLEVKTQHNQKVRVRSFRQCPYFSNKKIEVQGRGSLLSIPTAWQNDDQNPGVPSF